MKAGAGVTAEGITDVRTAAGLIVGFEIMRESACAERESETKKERGAMPDGLEEKTRKKKQKREEEKGETNH